MNINDNTNALQSLLDKMSQGSGYLPSSAVVQTSGQSDSLVMSQRAVTDYVDSLTHNENLIANVANKVPVVKVAEQPEYVDNISECSDTSKVYVLPNGHLAAYKTSEVITKGETVPNFTNLYDKSKGAFIKDGQRYSASGDEFKNATGLCAVYIPIQTELLFSTLFTIRIRGADIATASYWNNVYALSNNNDSGYGGGAITNSNLSGTFVKETNGDLTLTTKINANDSYNTWHTIIFNVLEGSVDESKLIVTLNEEITYTVTEGGTEIRTEWTDTGIEYNQPPNYSDRVVALETKTSQLKNDVGSLERKITSTGVTSQNIDAFAYPAYPPSPQLIGDGSSEADFNTSNVATSEVYAYMDALWNRYRTYMVRQNLGKDSSGQYDYYRYVFSKAYWRAWYKENYPKMFAWINGSTVIYSESVSPRVGDNMYATPYIGTVYNKVTAVNSSTVGVQSSRTVNNLSFTRYTEGDVEPTIKYTCPFAITSNYMGRMYTDKFEPSNSVNEYTHEYVVDSQGVKFYRYPFDDRKLDTSKLFSVFILANEHGNHGDSMIPCVTVMRMLKDLCGNTNIPFLRWLKENAVVTVIPLGNPYGTYRNANGVNINRNYDTAGWAGSDTDPQGGTLAGGQFGAYAGSEIETQYIMNTMQQCKPQAAISCHGRGIPSSTLLGEYNSSAHFQGCGFDAERMWKVEEALFSMYNFGFNPAWHTIDDETHNSYLNAGKSPSYIEYVGAVGGLIEIDDFEVGTLTRFTPLAMEQAYAEILLVLQNWCEEALEKSNK